MALSLIPYSRKSCIETLDIHKMRTAFISVQVDRSVFGIKLKRKRPYVVCLHVDARTPRYVNSLGIELNKREMKMVHDTVLEMRRLKYTSYDQLVARRLRKHIQHQRELEYE